MRLLLLLSVLGLISCSPKDPTDPKYVVAKVDGDKILRSELDKGVDLFLKSQGGSREQLPKPMVSQLEQQLLNQIVDGKLIIKQLVKTDEKELRDTADKQFKAFRDRFQDEKKYQEMLDRLGMDEATLKNQILEGAAQQIMIDKAKTEVPAISDEAARAFYDGNPQYWKRPEMVSARHILVKVGKDASTEEKATAKSSAEAARKRIRSGEDFATVAREVSDDPGSKSRGGVLPPFARGQMVPQFEQVAFKSPQGTLSPVFQTDFGYHFLEVMGKQKAGTATYEEMAPKIKGNLLSQEVRKILKQKFEKLRQEHKVEIFLPEPSDMQTSNLVPPAEK